MKNLIKNEGTRLKFNHTSESDTVARRSLDFGPAIVNTPISSVTFVI